MSLRCLIVDDYRANGEKIAEFAKRAGLEVLAIETDSDLALEQIKAMEVPPDVVFLDISMPGKDGLEMAAELMDIAPVVFTTAHSNYAAESYKLNVVYYLVKPITYEDFKKSVDKLKEKMEAQKNIPRVKKEYITLPGYGKNGIIKIKTDDVIYVECFRHYMQVHTTTKTYSVHSSMIAILKELGGPPFVRVHKSFAVNIEKVTELKDNTIYLNNGAKVYLGGTYRNDFLNLL